MFGLEWPDSACACSCTGTSRLNAFVFGSASALAWSSSGACSFPSRGVCIYASLSFDYCLLELRKVLIPATITFLSASLPMQTYSFGLLNAPSGAPVYMEARGSLFRSSVWVITDLFTWRRPRLSRSWFSDPLDFYFLKANPPWKLGLDMRWSAWS